MVRVGEVLFTLGLFVFLSPYLCPYLPQVGKSLAESPGNRGASNDHMYGIILFNHSVWNYQLAVVQL